MTSIGAIGLLAASLGARAPVSVDTASTVSAIDAYIERLSGFGYSGAVLIAVDGRVVLRKGYGFADRERAIPIRPQTIFDIGSLSKNFTAAAVLRLEADGILHVEDSLGKFLPDVPPDKRAITLHQLLTHTAGVTGPEHGYEVIDKPQALRAILDTPLRFPPGSQWAYSNSGYVLLAAVIEAASGQRYQDYMAQRIFRPAGLRSTGFWGRRLPPGEVAKGYDGGDVISDLSTMSGETWNDLGSGQIVSTVDDLYRWQQALEKHTILPAAEIEKMLTPVRHGPPSDEYFTDNYGYGVWVQTLSDGTHRITHGGQFLGFSASFVWLPDRKTVITALCNVRNELYPINRRADRAIPNLLQGIKVTGSADPPGFVHLGARERQRFRGTYVLPAGGRLTVFQDPRGLAVGASGQDATLLLDGHFERQQELDAQANRTARLVSTLIRGADSTLDAAHEIHDELAALGSGLGAFAAVRPIGTYVGGFTGDRAVSLVAIDFAHGSLCYRVEWDQNAIAGTSSTCRPSAAVTLVEPTSDDDLTGWNIVTLERFSVHFDATFAVMRITAGAHSAVARRDSVP